MEYQKFNEPVDSDTANTNPGGMEKHLETWDEIRELDIQIEWLIDRLIPKESVTVLYGRGGVGKTWISMDLARCIGGGTQFAGHKTVKTPVVYIDFENPLAVLSSRMKKLGGGGGVLFWRGNREGFKAPKLDSDDWAAYKALPKGSLLIFDTLRAAHSGDENSSCTIGVVMGRLKELRDIGFTIILLHHTPKNSDTTLKGSTSIADLGDHTLCLTKGGDEEFTKTCDAIYRFGVIGKTRYEPYLVRLTFAPEKGFELAPGPRVDTSTREDEALGKMFMILIESGPMNKTEFLKCCGDAGIGSRQELINLFEAGTGQYWTVETGAHNAHHVKPVQFSSLPDPYSPQKLENCEEATGNDCCPGTADANKTGTEASAPPQDAPEEAIGLSEGDCTALKIIEEQETQESLRKPDIGSKIPPFEPGSGETTNTNINNEREVHKITDEQDFKDLKGDATASDTAAQAALYEDKLAALKLRVSEVKKAWG